MAEALGEGKRRRSPKGRTVGSIFSLFHLDQNLFALHSLSLFHMQHFYLSILKGLDADLHLHGLDRQKGLTFLNDISHAHRDTSYLPWHGRGQSSGMVVADASFRARGLRQHHGLT